MTTRRAGILLCCTTMPALLGCGESTTALAVEAARAACAVTMQARYEPISADQEVTFARVANASPDTEQFEFVWKRDQIAGLLWRLRPQEIERPPGDPAATGAGDRYTVVLEAITAGGEPAYVCRGSLKVRSMHGVWLRRTGSSGQATETKLTTQPVSF